MVQNEVAAATDAYARPAYLEEPDPEEEFEGDYFNMVEKLERERGAPLLDSERDRLWQAANEADEDPTTRATRTCGGRPSRRLATTSPMWPSTSTAGWSSPTGRRDELEQDEPPEDPDRWRTPAGP